jgi:hypothetical protein
MRGFNTEDVSHAPVRATDTDRAAEAALPPQPTPV